VSVPTRSEERCREAADGARTLGADLAVLYRDQPCRVEDVPMHRLVGRFDALVAETRPGLVITHSARDLHWDHRLVHHATVSSLRRTPCDLLAFLSSPEMNAHCHSIGQCFADITETIEKKLEAIAAHKTQMPKVDLESARDLARAMGRICGVPYAESFEVLRMRV
jgi:LmbE family N-acetylglucosaminyl deacetylase